ncbi:MAG: VWA domain-containing protein [Dehalococcoidia bacterium]|nr:VWA domain-containing protein [Dehalococcoidia bacterium]
MSGVPRPPAFPFSAIVGNEELKQALLLTLVEPRIGGVLIRGDRGTAKSTIVRAIAGLLPPIQAREGCAVSCDPADGPCSVCASAGAVGTRLPRVVDVPLGATEDRLAGSLNLVSVLARGDLRFEAGLIGGAHRGVLYVDEVNLLPDHLVDMLLDVAASGVNVVERDGVSTTHPARFLLIGTMNPEEGDLRPQLLDRFGLVVDVSTPTDAETRAEVVRRRVEFDRAPEAFARRFESEEDSLRASLVRARASLTSVTVDHLVLRFIVDLCARAEVDGLRADITMHRAASARAALANRSAVLEEDVLAVAPLVLAHRQRAPRHDRPAPPSLDELLGDARARAASPPPSEEQSDRDDPGGQPVNASAPRDGDRPEDSHPRGDEGPTRAPSITAPVERASTPILPRPPGRGDLARGRGRSRASAARGRAVGAMPWDGRSGDIAMVPTLLRWRGGHRSAHAIQQRRRAASPRRLVLFAVDTSGSMAAAERMARTKGAVLRAVDELYAARDEVGLLAFGGRGAALLVAPGRQVTATRRAIEELPAGGGTPLPAALIETARVLGVRGRRASNRARLAVIVTDGRTRSDLRAASAALRAAADQTLVVDTEVAHGAAGRARRLADLLGGAYTRLP